MDARIPAPPVRALTDAPRDGVAILAAHHRLGEIEVRFDPAASRIARHGVWRGPGGSYDETDFDGWRPRPIDQREPR